MRIIATWRTWTSTAGAGRHFSAGSAVDSAPRRGNRPGVRVEPDTQTDPPSSISPQLTTVRQRAAVAPTDPIGSPAAAPTTPMDTVAQGDGPS